MKNKKKVPESILALVPLDHFCKIIKSRVLLFDSKFNAFDPSLNHTLLYLSSSSFLYKLGCSKREFTA